jgi:thiosulfate/3-mercaptopyruvate sulfurtransferase
VPAFETIVAPEQLFELLDDRSVVIVDCRHTLADFDLGRRLYEESHIPGALFADVERDLAGEKTGANGRHPMPEPQRFAEFLESIGVHEHTQLVAYDAGADMFAARLWFLARWIGHKNVAILDGGFAAWERLGYPAVSDPGATRSGSLRARVREDYVVDAEFVYANLERGNYTLLDARAADRFAGENEHVDPIAGHIPGARNRWFKQNFAEDGRLKDPEILRAEFEALGVAPDRIVHQCGSGVSAAVNALAMEHAGLSGSRIYGGSWSEWISDARRPIAVGAE